MSEKSGPAIPDDLVPVAEAARMLGKSYRGVRYHVQTYGLARWETGTGVPLVSIAEMRAYYARRDVIRPKDSDEGGA